MIRSKILLPLILLFFVLGCSASHQKDTDQAIDVATKFVGQLYQSKEDIDSAYALTSKQFQVVANKGMTRQLRDVAGEVVGDYLSNDRGADVTSVLAPKAPANGRIIRINVVYREDPDGQILVSMIKEDKAWKVMGFNINSPKIAANQTRTLIKPAGTPPSPPAPET